jgi:hypothetical protein
MTESIFVIILNQPSSYEDITNELVISRSGIHFSLNPIKSPQYVSDGSANIQIDRDIFEFNVYVKNELSDNKYEYVELIAQFEKFQLHLLNGTLEESVHFRSIYINKIFDSFYNLKNAAFVIYYEDNDFFPFSSDSLVEMYKNNNLPEYLLTRNL